MSRFHVASTSGIFPDYNTTRIWPPLLSQINMRAQDSWCMTMTPASVSPRSPPSLPHLPATNRARRPRLACGPFPSSPWALLLASSARPWRSSLRAPSALPPPTPRAAPSVSQRRTRTSSAARSVAVCSSRESGGSAGAGLQSASAAARNMEG